MNSFNEYQEEAFKTALPQCRNITYMTLGLTNESGEVAGKVKKYFRGDNSRPAVTEELKKELGDCLWYIAGLAEILGLSLSEIAGHNIEKLRSRQERGTLQGNGDNR